MVSSQHLKLLHEHGFLEQTQKSKWVYYKTATHIENSHAKNLAPPLKEKLRSEGPCSKELVRMVTAFTHPRRIDIAKAITDRNKNFEQLASECNISGQALYRHLNKLIDRNLILQDKNIYRIIHPKAGLLKALLLCCNEDQVSHTS